MPRTDHRSVEVKQHNISIDNLKVNYYTADNPKARNTLLLLHGAGGGISTSAWWPAIPYLAENFRVVAPDMPGYGFSQKAPQSSTLEYNARFVESFIDQMHFGKLSIAGHSMGGGVALGYATMSHTHHIDKLILVDTFGLQSRPFSKFACAAMQLPPSALRFAVDQLGDHTQLVKAIVDRITRNRGSLSHQHVDALVNFVKSCDINKALVEFLRSEMRPSGFASDYSNKLKQVEQDGIKLHIIHGEDDMLFPVQTLRQKLEGISAQLHIMPACGHAPQRDNPEQFSSIMNMIFEDALLHRLLRKASPKRILGKIQLPRFATA